MVEAYLVFLLHKQKQNGWRQVQNFKHMHVIQFYLLFYGRTFRMVEKPKSKTFYIFMVPVVKKWVMTRNSLPDIAVNSSEVHSFKRELD